MSCNSLERERVKDGNRPLRVAMIGAGIFATEAHAPVLRMHPETFCCVAVWSRRIKAAQALADTFHQEHVKCDAYGGQDGLEMLLARSDFFAVIMALPLDVQPNHVLRVLQAGKHVLSEKPIAPSIREAQRVVEEYRSQYQPKKLVWSVAENYRYEPAWRCAADAVCNTIGTPLLLTLAMHSPFAPSNKYLNTSWRANPSWGDAGLFVDAFIHGVAGLRLVAPSPVKTVSATLRSMASHIAGFDTMVSHLQLQDGLQGVVTVTYAGNQGLLELMVTGTNGRVELKRIFGTKPGYQLTDGNGRVSVYPFGGIEAELLAFANVCLETTSQDTDNGMRQQIGVPNDYNTPDEALSDIKLLEAFIESGREGGAVKTVQCNSISTPLQNTGFVHK